MEQASWNTNLITTSGLTLTSIGSADIHASTFIPITLEKESSTSLDLQLADTSKIDVLGITSDINDGSVEVTSDGNTFKITGPLVLFGELVARFSADLSNLSVENKHTTDTANIQILIGRNLN